jgi:hypothetical protein
MEAFVMECPSGAAECAKRSRTVKERWRDPEGKKTKGFWPASKTERIFRKCPGVL